MTEILNRLRRSLPVDGQGLVPSPDLDLRWSRKWAAKLYWRRLAWPVRPAAIMMARMLWVVAGAVRALRFGRAHGAPFRATLRLVGDCVAAGAPPNEAWIWRNVASALHPLPGNATSLLLARLADPAQQRDLSDKLATAKRLKQAGLPTPRLHAVLAAGSRHDPSQLSWARPGAYFIKPRHGLGGRGAFSLEVLQDGIVRFGQGHPVGLEVLRQRLEVLLHRDDLLVQEALGAAPELADLVTEGRPPVLRLTVAREPRGDAFLHSALLTIDVPGENHRHFIRGQIRAPINPADGQALAGLWFLYPHRRFNRLPWNDAQLSGLAPAGYAEAANMVLQASDFWPGVPLINWDLILTPRGPVFLEGNCGGNWILTNLSSLADLQAVSLAPLLRRWSIQIDRAPNGLS